MGANPRANGGILLRDLRMPDFRDYAVPVTEARRGSSRGDAGHGLFLRDVHEDEHGTQFPRFRSGRNRVQSLDALFRSDEPLLRWRRSLKTDDHLAPDGRVMEVLSEHLCQGWLEGYLLTGRHGFINCYEAFIHIVDSMFNQHAKWLKVSREIPWRRPIASLNYLLTSHVWRQDHNGFSHQDPGFIDHVVNKKAEVIRVYLAARRQHAAVGDRSLPAQPRLCQRGRGRQTAVAAVAGHGSAVEHCTAGIGIWEWASNDQGGEPDVVMACCGDVPTMETLAAVEILAQAAARI